MKKFLSTFIIFSFIFLFPTSAYHPIIHLKSYMTTSNSGEWTYFGHDTNFDYYVNSHSIYISSTSSPKQIDMIQKVIPRNNTTTGYYALISYYDSNTAKIHEAAPYDTRTGDFGKIITIDKTENLSDHPLDEKLAKNLWAQYDDKVQKEKESYNIHHRKTSFSDKIVKYGIISLLIIILGYLYKNYKRKQKEE